MRADAERNRELIIKAARTAFAAEGVHVSMAEIARRAGVGFATVLRRFPTKQDLVLEVLRGQLAQFQESITSAQHEPDPWRAFASPIEACCAHQAGDPGLAGALSAALAAVNEPLMHNDIKATFDRLAARAVSSGELRPDVSLADIILIVKANAGVIANSPGEEADASRRFISLALQGLRKPS